MKKIKRKKTNRKKKDRTSLKKSSTKKKSQQKKRPGKNKKYRTERKKSKKTKKKSKKIVIKKKSQRKKNQRHKVVSEKWKKKSTSRHHFTTKRKPTFNIPLASLDNIDKVVDWIEMKVLVSQKRFNSANLQSILAHRNVSLDRLKDIFLQIEQRKEIFKKNWPFLYDEKEKELSFSGNQNILSLYKFFLLFSLDVEITSENRKMFEACTTDLVKNLLRSKADGICLGYPRQSPVPTSFKDALDCYSKDAEENIKTNVLPSTKDCHLDSVVYRKFQDGRGGNFHLWGQCATGDNWIEKINDLNIETMRLHFFPVISKPLSFFAIPFVAKKNHMYRINDGLFLDRPRLMELFSSKFSYEKQIEGCLNGHGLH